MTVWVCLVVANHSAVNTSRRRSYIADPRRSANVATSVPPAGSTSYADGRPGFRWQVHEHSPVVIGISAASPRVQLAIIACLIAGSAGFKIGLDPFVMAPVLALRLGVLDTGPLELEMFGQGGHALRPYQPLNRLGRRHQAGNRAGIRVVWQLRHRLHTPGRNQISIVFAHTIEPAVVAPLEAIGLQFCLEARRLDDLCCLLAGFQHLRRARHPLAGSHDARPRICNAVDHLFAKLRQDRGDGRYVGFGVVGITLPVASEQEARPPGRVVQVLG